MQNIVNHHYIKEYKCRNCGKQFIVHDAQYEDPLRNMFKTKPKCPSCGSHDLESMDPLGRLCRKIGEIFT